MADPFFRTTKSADANAQNTTNNVDINTILYQQSEIEKAFDKLKEIFSRKDTSTETKAEIKQKLLELRDVYKNNQEILGDNKRVKVKKLDVKDKKQGRGFSAKNFMIGCGILGFIVLGGLFFSFYYLVQNPYQLSNIGLQANTAQILLQTFASVFFGVLMIAGFFLMVVNIYRLFKSKHKSKIGYIGGMLLGLVIFTLSLMLGSRVLSQVADISIDDILNNSNLVRSYMIIKNDKIYMDGSDDLYTIAPVNISFSLNTKLFDKQVIPSLGNDISIQRIILLCGNGEELSLDIESGDFNGSCFYAKKGNYPVNLSISYIDPKDQIVQYRQETIGDMHIYTQITLTQNNEAVPYNYTDFLPGKVPIRIDLDASDVFRETGLSTYQVFWDLDGDGEIDRQNQSLVSYDYLKDGVYNVVVNFPDLNKYLYTFTIRAEQSDVPVGTIEYIQSHGREYSFTINFVEQKQAITSYLFEVISKDSRKLVSKKETNVGSFVYTFENPGIYYVRASYITEDRKQGVIISDDIRIGISDVDFDYKMLVKTPTNNVFTVLGIIDGGVELMEVPSILQLKINRAQIENQGFALDVLWNDQALIYANGVYEFSVTSSETKELKIIAKNIDTDDVQELTIPVRVDLDSIIGKLIITPDTVGTSPFEVKFDASTTQINDVDDEIVFFTRDFGDGIIKKNLSESIVSHVYYYDFVQDSGEFHPRLIIQTKKGKHKTIGSDITILVKKPLNTLDIYIASHPTQVTKIGELVSLGLEIDGFPMDIKRDFGNGNTLECKGRECVETTQVYNTVGIYKIQVEVDFEHRTPLNGNINLVVE